MQQQVRPAGQGVFDAEPATHDLGDTSRRPALARPAGGGRAGIQHRLQNPQLCRIELAAGAAGAFWPRRNPQSQVGIGPDTAVTLLITMGDKPERLGGEASLAALLGASSSSAPREAGSTGTATAGVTGRPGKTRREVVRCLKRHVAREVFHLIQPVSSQPPS
ncbi:hypothetical protein [Streptomyces sp. NBC_01092]|uniref:hypothetical protein n=1 Tax=Streptomyces sp. NBC_01092 TaxID=2903748 RepID=UPI00386367B1